MIKNYTQQIDAPVNIEIGKKYHKDPHMSFPFARMSTIHILSHAGGVVTATIGNDTFVQTITEDEAHAYINHQGGYHDEA